MAGLDVNAWFDALAGDVAIGRCCYASIGELQSGLFQLGLPLEYLGPVASTGYQSGLGKGPLESFLGFLELGLGYPQSGLEAVELLAGDHLTFKKRLTPYQVELGLIESGPGKLDRSLGALDLLVFAAGLVFCHADTGLSLVHLNPVIVLIQLHQQITLFHKLVVVHQHPFYRTRHL